MLSDYVMNSIDNLFSDKLLHQQNHYPLLQHNPNKPHFNSNTIKKQLPNVIRKDSNHSRSPACRREKSVSPVNKSRLKTILENNRPDNIKSVVKKNNKSATSPSKPIQYMQINPVRSKGDFDCRGHLGLEKKESDLIRYYREERKSMEKTMVGDGYQKQVGKCRKSRIFKPPALSHQVSKTEFR